MIIISLCCTAVAGVAGMLVASGEFSPNFLFKACRLVCRTDQAIQRGHRCGVSCPGGRPGLALDDTFVRRRENRALLNTLGIAPKLRQNRN